MAARREILRRLSRHKMTGFQRSVLVATMDIPRGKVSTYKDIAKRIGRPKAFRAVGTALKNNPMPLLIPCHRVIKSDGDIGNYFYGKRRKLQLLQSEGALRR